MSRYRVYVPVSDETRQAMQALADVRKSTLTAICAEMLETVAPIALDMANALKTAQSAPAKALRMINESMERELGNLDQLQLDMTPKATRKKKTG